MQHVSVVSAHTQYLDISSPGEEVAELVERHRHDTVSNVKGLFHTIAVVDVDIDVEDTRVVPDACKRTRLLQASVTEARKK